MKSYRLVILFLSFSFATLYSMEKESKSSSGMSSFSYCREKEKEVEDGTRKELPKECDTKRSFKPYEESKLEKPLDTMHMKAILGILDKEAEKRKAESEESDIPEEQYNGIPLHMMSPGVREETVMYVSPYGLGSSYFATFRSERKSRMISQFVDSDKKDKEEAGERLKPGEVEENQ